MGAREVRRQHRQAKEQRCGWQHAGHVLCWTATTKGWMACAMVRGNGGGMELEQAHFAEGSLRSASIVEAKVGLKER